VSTGFTLGTNCLIEKLGLSMVGAGDHRQRKVFKAFKADADGRVFPNITESEWLDEAGI
jgi:hypothetical protein